MGVNPLPIIRSYRNPCFNKLMGDHHVIGWQRHGVSQDFCLLVKFLITKSVVQAAGICVFRFVIIFIYTSSSALVEGLKVNPTFSENAYVHQFHSWPSNAEFTINQSRVSCLINIPFQQLGGIVRPNDGRCHMELNSDGSYEYTLGTVYVSVYCQ